MPAPSIVQREVGRSMRPLCHPSTTMRARSFTRSIQCGAGLPLSKITASILGTKKQPSDTEKSPVEDLDQVGNDLCISC